MVPSVVGAEESDESIVEDTEVGENESGEAESEESETIETEDETSTNESAGEESTDDTVDHEGETSESKESSNESDGDQKESADSIEDQEENQEKKQLDSEKDSKESTYEEQEDSTLDGQEKEHDSEQDDRIDEKNSSEDTTEETSSEESEDKQTTQSQQNTMSIQSISSDGSYKVGDRAPGISDFKVKLNHIGFNGITVTDYFGDYTEQRVLEFQTYYGLPETGEVEADTLSELNAVYNSPHQLGKSHSENKSIKEKLNALGYGGIKVTNYFGDYTEKRVIEFQRDHNLKAHGIVDAKTLAKLNGIYDSAVRPGESDPILIDVKEKLNSLGFSGIIVTSYYGDYTVQRVKEFQRFADLSANGVLDESTLGALDELAASGYSQGDSHSNIASMKRKLNQVGFSGILVTDYFGNFTEKRVREFQDYYNLSVTGKANQETLDQLDAVYNSSLQVGKSDSDLRGIKEKLNAIGYGGIIVTSYFGDFTEKRVKQFQRDYNLKPHGIIDGKTLNKINDIYDSAIWPGQSDSALIDIKEKLNSLGFGGIIVSSFYGSFSEKRVIEFQNYYGLSANGIIDSRTLDKINEVYNHPLQLGKSSNDIKEFKHKLNTIGFGGILETSYFGDFTNKRVKEFQEHYNLKPHGIVDKVTLSKLNYAFNNSYYKGKSDSEIIEVKKLLNNLGYSGIIESDYFGEYTEGKVKEFQKDYGLKVTGVVDPSTYKELKNSVVKLFIDPGHGGHDSGATGYGLKEKDIVLDISLRLANELTNSYYGIMVNLSRTVDKFIELERRSERANQLGSDYFLSVHSNAYMGLGKGFETFIHDRDITLEDKERQEDIHNYLVKRIDAVDRGKQDANFNVLRNSDMPSILIEYLFIDNKEENDLLRQSSYRQKLAQWTAEAIGNSFRLKEK